MNQTNPPDERKVVKMNAEIRQIIENAMREAYLSGHYDGYKSGKTECASGHMETRSHCDSGYLKTRDEDLARFKQVMNTPNP